MGELGRDLGLFPPPDAVAIRGRLRFARTEDESWGIIRKTGGNVLNGQSGILSARGALAPIDVSLIGCRYNSWGGRILRRKAERCGKTPGGAETREGSVISSFIHLPWDSVCFRGLGGFVSSGIVSSIGYWYIRGGEVFWKMVDRMVRKTPENSETRAWAEISCARGIPDASAAARHRWFR